MSNIRLQSILRNKVEETAKIDGCQISFAFIRLMLKEVFELDDFEIDEAITDGGMDKGIDAIFEQINDDGENILNVVQSKYFEQNPDKTIDENSKNLVVEAVSNYILGDYPLENLNVKLRNKVISYRARLSNGKIDKVALIFLTNGQMPAQNIISELEKFKLDQEGQIYYQIFCEADLFQVFLPPSAGSIGSIELRIVKDSGSGEKTILNLPDIDTIQGRVCKVDIIALAEIVKNNPNIFSANVRAFQSLRNKVNEQIASTLKDSEMIKEFIYLNNGITIICDDSQVKPGGEIIELIRPSIINGCQTASTIFEVYKEGKMEANLGFVLVRILKTRDSTIKEKIIKASNTQTAIKNRDLISEEKIQKELESQFLSLGYFYERKRGLHKDKSQDKVVDLERAAQCYLALYLRRPAEAKNKKSEIYKSYYEQIFNDKLTANQLLVGWVLFNKINDKIKSLRKKISDERRSILGNSIIHLLPLFDEWAIKPFGKILSDIEDDITVLDRLFESNMDSVIAKLETSINSIKKNKDNFNPQYFFKSSDSFDKILNTKPGEPKYYIELNEQNIKRIRDLRYYKPEEYSFDGIKFNKIVHWNDLFVKLIELYSENNSLENGNLDFIDAGNRKLVISNPNSDEKKIRKEIKNNLWLLTNFDSKKLSNFCFEIAEKLKFNLKIKLRPTLYRIKKKYKKH